MRLDGTDETTFKQLVVEGEHQYLKALNPDWPERIPAEDAPRLFERFARLERARTSARAGYGLGLSIVRAIVRAHRGQATASAPPEGGLAVEVSLPRRREP